MFWKRKQKITSDGLASILLEDCLTEVRIQPLRENLGMDMKQAFQERAYIYQIAATLVALDLEAKRQEAFKAVQDNLLTSLNHTSSYSQVCDAVKRATYDIANLVASNAKPYTWARIWYTGIGIEESNPAVLAHLSMQWLNYYTTVLAILRNFKLIEG